ncbi:MAG: TetR/AcrR family transcriptional regulator [Acidimicrobiales bacterium]|nr:TetR/AcrR family transcriptional regulator [Acidimicrobiales bacterium]
MATSKAATGRPRDPDIDAAVLASARSLLASHGYEAMSVVAVADAAGTTRQAIYRRWATKADLATAAIASLSQADQRPDTDDPFADLVLELGAYYQGVTRPNGISMVGSMLQEATDPDLKALFRERIIEPRRERLRHILQRSVDAGLLDAGADIDYAVAACTGTFYALHLTGKPIPKTWAKRTAALVWRSCGGGIPTEQAK